MEGGALGVCEGSPPPADDDADAVRDEEDAVDGGGGVRAPETSSADDRADGDPEAGRFGDFRRRGGDPVEGAGASAAPTSAPDRRAAGASGDEKERDGDAVEAGVAAATATVVVDATHLDPFDVDANLEEAQVEGGRTSDEIRVDPILDLRRPSDLGRKDSRADGADGSGPGDADANAAGWLGRLRRRRPRKGGSQSQPPPPSGDQVADDDAPQDQTDGGIGWLDEGADDGATKGEIELPEDSFSMFYCADNATMHVLPLCVYLVQVWILYLLFEALRDQEEGSSVGLGARIVACLVSIFTSGDFVDGLLLMGGPVGRRGPGGAPRCSVKWEFINLLRLSEGIFLVAISFMFVAQSSDVVDLFQNFAAVAFVGELDNGFHRLSRKGIFGSAAKRVALKVMDSRFYTTHQCLRRLIRCFLFVLIPTLMLTALAYLFDSTPRPMEGYTSLYLGHGDRRTCSVCKEHSIRPPSADFCIGRGRLCVPLPNEPIAFTDSNGTEARRQLGLQMNRTHISVFATGNTSFFEPSNSQFFSESLPNETAFICDGDDGAVEVASFELGFSPIDQWRLIPIERAQFRFAISLDAEDGLAGRIVDAGDVECLAQFPIDGEVCDGLYDGALMEELGGHELTRAWVEFNLRVFEGALYNEC